MLQFPLSQTFYQAYPDSKLMVVFQRAFRSSWGLLTSGAAEEETKRRGVLMVYCHYFGLFRFTLDWYRFVLLPTETGRTD